MRARLPAIIQDTIALNPDYPASIVSRLSRLRDDIAAGAPTAPLEAASADDHAAWLEALNQQKALITGELTWHNAEWFFAETYAYRCLIQAARYHENGRDPFLPRKLEELHGEALWTLLQGALQEAADPKAGLMAAFEVALWGNRIDLSYAAALERGTEISAEDLLVDDRAPLMQLIQERWPLSSVVIVADNAGSELAMDLVLADRLLQGFARRVVLYLKAHPTFVSDATTTDLWLMLREMERRGGSAAELSRRLIDAWEAGRLRCLPHRYWNSSVFLRDASPEMRQALNGAGLLIIKGDANYRRAVGDCLWAVDTPFADVMAYLDAPTLCLRTLKSDPIVGLPTRDLAEALDREDAQWRTNGRRGLIQFKPASYAETRSEH